jgi:DHA1 family tetracycline resistance protein-like MFS transporter
VQSVWTFYTKYKFGWDEMMIGISLGVVGVLIMFVQGFLIRIVIPKYGDTRTIFVGLLLYFAGLVLFAFASKGWMMFVFLIPYCLGGIAGPALQGIISAQVPPGEQGELQGGLTSIMSVTSIVGPLLMNYLFSYFSGSNAPIHFPGMPYFVGAVFMAAAAILATPTLNKIKKSRAAVVQKPPYDIYEKEANGA